MFFVLLNFAAAWTAPLLTPRQSQSAYDFAAPAVYGTAPAAAPLRVPDVLQPKAPTAVSAKTTGIAALCGLGAMVGYGLRSSIAANPVTGYARPYRAYGARSDYNRRYGRGPYGRYGGYGGYQGGAYSEYDDYDRYSFSGDDRLGRYGVGRYGRMGGGRYGSMSPTRYGRNRYYDGYARGYGNYGSYGYDRGYGMGRDAYRGAYDGSYEGSYEGSYDAAIEQDMYGSGRAYREGLRDGSYGMGGYYDREYMYNDY